MSPTPGLSDDRPASEKRFVALQYYNAARAEILQRLALREQVLLAFLTAIGVMASLIGHASEPAGPQGLLRLVLYGVPWLSLAFTMAIRRHNFIIRQLGKYVHDELGAVLCQPLTDSDADDANKIRHWDNSRTLLGGTLQRFISREIKSDACFLLIPGICSVIYASWEPVWMPIRRGSWDRIDTGQACATVIGAIGLLWIALILRKEFKEPMRGMPVA